jgi:hypothetical protein
MLPSILPLLYRWFLPTPSLFWEAPALVPGGSHMSQRELPSLPHVFAGSSQELPLPCFSSCLLSLGSFGRLPVNGPGSPWELPLSQYLVFSVTTVISWKLWKAPCYGPGRPWELPILKVEAFRDRWKSQMPSDFFSVTWHPLTAEIGKDELWLVRKGNMVPFWIWEIWTVYGFLSLICVIVFLASCI